MRLRSIGAFAFSSFLCAAFGCSLSFDVGPFGADGGGGLPPDSGIADGGSASDVGPADGPPSASPIAFVQSKNVHKTTTSGATASMTFNAPTKGGDLVVVAVAGESDKAITVSTITDDASNSYMPVGQRSVDGNCNDALELWYAANVKAGATSVTVTMSSSSQLEAWAAEFSGLSKTGALDKSGHNDNGPSSQRVSAPALVPAATPALVISACMTCTASTGLSLTNPFTSLGGSQGQDVAYLITQESRAFGAVWNTDKTGTWNASSVVFRH